MITTNIHQLSTQHVAGVHIDTNVETDPIFRHSPAYTITEQDIINWDAATGGVDLSSYVTKSDLVAQSYITINDVVFPDYSNTYQTKGNYITQETDPVFSASPAAGITTQDIHNWNEGAGVDLSSYVTKTELVAQSYVTSTNLPDYSNTYQAKGNYLTQETDPIFTNSPAGSITHTDIANWNAAAGTIDMSAYVTKNELVTQSYITINDVVFPDYSNTYQAKGNYLTSESDPVFSASPAAGITAQDITNWNTGASVDLSSYVTKSELSAQSYLTTESDPVFSASPAAGITSQDIQNWNTGSGVDLNAYVKKTGSTSQSITVSDYFNDGEYKQKALTTTVQSTNNYGYYAQTKVEMVRQANGDYQPRVRIETHGDNGELADVHIYEDHVSIDATDVTIGAPYTYMQNAMVTYNGARDYVASYNYVANQLANYDLSAYVTKSELSAQSYLTSVTFPDYSSTYQAKGDYVTPSQLVAQGYITSVTFPDYSNTYQAKGNYLTSETDPVFSASPAAGITTQDITNWNAGSGIDLSSYVTKSELSAQSYLTSVTFPDYSNTYQAKGNYVTQEVLTQQAYLTSETDPVFSASPAGSITSTDIANWNAAAGGIDLSSYVTKTELSSQSYVTNTQIQNYGYTTVRLVTEAQYQDTQDNILYVITDADPIDATNYVTKSQLAAQSYITISDVVFPDYSSTYQAVGNYLTSETDPVFSASPAGSITSTDISNWNAAAGGIDLSSYVTKSELSAQSYLTSATVTYPDYFTTYTSYAYINDKIGDIETLLAAL